MVQELCENCQAPLPPGVRSEYCPLCSLRGALELSDDRVLIDEHIRRIGDYELLEQIARGGMGIVYRARQRSLGRMVAVKMIVAGHFASDEMKQRFRAEAESAARLRHPNIVAIHEIGEHEGQPFLSMDYIAGRTLAELVRDGPLGPAQAARCVRAIAQAVHFAHEHGTLHRDLKPSNVLIDEHDQPHITDFGLAKQLGDDSELTLSGQVLGSPAYMSPEQAAGRRAKISPASDVYSLGAILYHLVTGRPPFQGGTPQSILLQSQNEEPVAPRRLNASAPLDLETICLKCLEKDPAKRYATAQSLAQDLERFLNGEPVQARPLSSAGRLWRWSQRHRTVAGLLCLIVVLLLAVSIGSLVAAVRIKRAEQRAVTNLRESLLAQAQALRFSGHTGQRLKSLAVLQRANAPGLAPEMRLRLRNETIATLALPDVQLEHPRGLARPPNAILGRFDSKLEVFARAEERGPVIIQRVADGREIARISTEGRRIEHVVEISPNHRYVALRHGGEIGIWDLQSGKMPVAARSWVSQFAFSPKGDMVAFAGKNESVLFFDLPSGQETYRWTNLHTNSSGAEFHSLRFSPDGSHLACGGTGKRGVEIRDATTGALQFTLPQVERVVALAWSADGARLATGDADGRLSVWNAANGRREFNLDGHLRYIRCLAFNPASTLLASSSEDVTIRLWDLSTGRAAITVASDSYQMDFSADGQRLALAWQRGGFGWLRLLPPEGFVTWRPARAEDDVASISFSPDGSVIASLAFGVVFLNDAHSGRNLGELQIPHCQSVKFGPRENELLIASKAEGVFRFPWRRTTRDVLEFGPREKLLNGPGWGRITITADANRTALVNRQTLFTTTWSGTNLSNTLRIGPHPGLFDLALSPDGRLLTTGSFWNDNAIRIWHANTGALVRELNVGANLRSTFSPDGRWLVTYGETCRLWKTADWSPGAPLSLDKQDALGCEVAFSPDGRLLAVTQVDREIHLFDFPSLQRLAVLVAPRPARIEALAFSPDSSELAAACPQAEVQLWDLRALRQKLAPLGLDW